MNAAKYTQIDYCFRGEKTIADGGVEDEEKFLAAGIAGLQQNAFYMHRALDSNNLRDALKYSAQMLSELRTSRLSPHKYYELDMRAFDELRKLEMLFKDETKRGCSTIELYELAQHAGNILPRLSIMDRLPLKAEEDSTRKRGAQSLSKAHQLPEDLLGEIKGRLFYSDQVRFGAVCKRWLSVNYQKTPSHSLPWLVLCSSSGTLRCADCLLYSPFGHISSHHLHEPFVFPILDKLWAAHHSFITAKHGWLLYSRHKVEDVDEDRGESFLLSPFDMTIIKLPPIPIHHKPSVASFSAQPNSPQCVFFLLHYSSNNFYASRHKITITTYSRQDHIDKWISMEVNNPDLSQPLCTSCGAAYIRGCFYLVSNRGNLAAYVVSTKEWNVVAHSQFPTGILIHREEERFTAVTSNFSRLVESNGELLLVYLEDEARKNSGNTKSSCVLRFDWGNMDWVCLKSLSGGALFVGVNSFSVQFFGDARVANKVYYLGEDGCVVYSFNDDDAKLHYRGEGSGFKGWHGGMFMATVWIEPHDHLVKLLKFDS